MSRFMITSVHVPFSRQSTGGRRKLHVVGTFGDDTIARLDAAAHADQVSVAYANLDIAPRETLAAGLYEHIRAAGLHQEGFLRDRRHPLPLRAVENGDWRLANEELSIAVVDVELHRQGARLRVDDPRVMHVVGVDHDRIRPSGNLDADVVDVVSQWQIGCG